MRATVNSDAAPPWRLLISLQATMLDFWDMAMGDHRDANPRIKACPAPDCGGVFEQSREAALSGDSCEATCSECGTKRCGTCMELYHYGRRGCM